MRVSAAFPSAYLKASDLQGRRVSVKILRVEMQELGDEVKPVVYFEDKAKGLVLNKTNANTISAAYGDEMEDWEGKEAVLYETEVEYQGRRMPGICCLVPPRKPQKPTDEPGPNDDIPF
jgi:hypothetical protein